MLKASGVSVRPELPAIRESRNEGASTPDVTKGAAGGATPLTGAAAQRGEGTKSPGSGSKAANLPEQLKGLMRVWGERDC